LIEAPWEFWNGAFWGACEGRDGVYFHLVWGRLGEVSGRLLLGVELGRHMAAEEMDGVSVGT
jgi:hypothetical protein